MRLAGRKRLDRKLGEELRAAVWVATGQSLERIPRCLRRHRETPIPILGSRGALGDVCSAPGRGHRSRPAFHLHALEPALWTAGQVLGGEFHLRPTSRADQRQIGRLLWPPRDAANVRAACRAPDELRPLVTRLPFTRLRGRDRQHRSLPQDQVAKARARKTIPDVLRGRAVLLPAASAERLAVHASAEVHGGSPPPLPEPPKIYCGFSPAPVPPHDDPGERGQVPAMWLGPSPVRTKPSVPASVRHCGPSIATAGPRREGPICWSKPMAATTACPPERPAPTGIESHSSPAA